MNLECRSFNDAGTVAAAAELQRLREHPDRDPSQELLTDPALCEVVGGPVTLPLGNLATRWQFGIWLNRELTRAIDDDAVLRRSGLWTWLALFFFPIIRPSGTRVFEDARYILNRDDFRKRYRHLVAGPYHVFTVHELEPQVVRGLLATPPHAPGDLYEQFASRQELVTSGAVMQLVTQMYFDPGTGALKRGSSANARRLAEVLTQFDVTHDFATVSVQRLIDMLPREFRRFTRKT